MPKNDYIAQLRRHLAELAYPTTRLQRMVREMAEHHEDLRQAARAERLGEAEAEARANEQLGEPRLLAEKIAASLPAATWWGRHSLVSFGVLPFLTFPLLWAAFMLLNLWLGYGVICGWNQHRADAIADNPTAFHYAALMFRGLDLTAIGLATAIFCWLAHRAGVRFTWIMVVCVICSLYASLSWIGVRPHNISAGLTRITYHHGMITWQPQYLRALVPWLVVGAFRLWQRWKTRRFCEPIAA